MSTFSFGAPTFLGMAAPGGQHGRGVCSIRQAAGQADRAAAELEHQPSHVLAPAIQVTVICKHSAIHTSRYTNNNIPGNT